MAENLLVSWSSGKDSALALHAVKGSDHYEVKALLTTVADDNERISMHGLRHVLLERQAASTGYPLQKVFLPRGASNEQYETTLLRVLEKCRRRGVSSVVYGDIFLADIRRYRENHLEKAEMSALFPLWKRDTSELAREFIDFGFKAFIISVDGHVLDRAFLGRTFDRQFLSELPSGVDPCGENGEFHTFVFDGPIFREAIPCRVGEVLMEQRRFYLCDLIPV